MKKVDMRKVMKVFVWLIVAFVAMFLLRWSYQVFFSRRDVQINYYNGYENFSLARSYSNVASEKFTQLDFAGQSVTIDQKYEKTADLSSNTKSFRDDDQKLRQVIQDNGAIVQSERMSGLAGHQVLSLAIGVKPDSFDLLVSQVKEIGEIQSFSVNQVDKTTEYMELLAEQTILEKTRDAYIAIKGNGGNIQDLLAIEQKILEVERDLQNLGVNMGVFSTDYSFCTVNFSLNEYRGTTISTRYILSNAWSSFTWTFVFFLVGGISVCGVLFGLWLILWLLAAIAVYGKKQ